MKKISALILIVLIAVSSAFAADTVVLYFSHTGNNAWAARVISEMTSSDLFEIATVKEYPMDNDEAHTVAAEELAANARPELATSVDISQYENVFICYPIWSGTAPMAIFTFLDEYDLSGKNVLAFTACGGSAITTSLEQIRAAEPGANVLDGLKISASTVGTADAEIAIATWIASTGLF